jgi:uncharacterized repeat protein (TIGR01451 family)
LSAQPWERFAHWPSSNSAQLNYSKSQNHGSVLFRYSIATVDHPVIFSMNNAGDSIFRKEISMDSVGNGPRYFLNFDVKIDNNGNRIVVALIDYVYNSVGFNYLWFIMKFDSLGNLGYYKRLGDFSSIELLMTKTNHSYHFTLRDSVGTSFTNTIFPFNTITPHELIHDIYKFDLNGNFVWRKRFIHPDTTGYSTMPNPKTYGYMNPLELSNGDIAFLNWDTTMSNVVYLTKMNANGQIISTTPVSNFIKPLYFNQPNFGACIGSDTSLFYFGIRQSTSTPSALQSFIIKLNSNNQISDSLISDSLFFYGVGEVSNNKLLASFSGLNSNYFNGVISLNKHLSILSSLPEQYFRIYSNKIIPNYFGGCTMYGYYNNPGYTGDFTALICNYDSLFNTYPSKLTGSVYQDNNKDCAFNSGDLKLPYRSIVCTNAQGKNFYSYSNSIGNYTLAVPNNNYTVMHTPGLYKSVICPSMNPVYSFSNNTHIQNFYDTIVPNINDLKISLVSDPFWLNSNGYINILYENVGTKTVNAVVKFIKNSNVSFSVVTSNTNTISGDTLLFSINSILPDSSGYISICLTPSSNVNSGTTLAFKAMITNTLIDSNPNNNIDSLINVYYGALRVAAPSLSVSTSNNINVNKPLYISVGEELTYKIRFQNTSGNAVKDVLIIDTLSSYLDYSTLKPLKASAPYSLSLSTNGKLIITFKNINLQDSAANENASKGYIIFRIQPKTNWPVGRKIHNQANIYFDYFKVITTNQTNNIRLNDVGISKNYSNSKAEIQIYPNPSNGYFLIDKNENLIIQNIEVFSISGQKLLSQTNESNSNQKILDLSNLEHGFYILKLFTSQGVISKKIIIKK